ncbi:VWA domain-containing protein [Luteirhabdus pelagi]|uniref:VWA domain-containing protein n=1 Tax=Luteirhabdus pelagi TaxID=2792783 RepID=UPI00193A8949|nr:VWA domain-containing protein [Luteirhabdus pelagi]
MTTATVFFIILAALVAALLSFLMYGWKSSHRASLRWTFGILRFLSLFALFLLLINPTFTSETYTLEKPNLSVLIDNSASIEALERTEDVRNSVQQLQKNSALQDRFNISYYTFGQTFQKNDSLSFSEENTNVSTALSTLKNTQEKNRAPTILITDGNQTLGSDYEFMANTYNNAIYPLIAGDSIAYTDLRINRINNNRYAFLKNQFPVEVFLSYTGNEAVTSAFIVQQNGGTVFRQNVSFSEENSNQTLQFTLPASAVGVQKYTARLVPLSEEKNTANNSAYFAVEVIDQATNVLIASELTHPDHGMLQKSITSNKQRTATIQKPSEALSNLEDYQLVILFQPTRAFANLMQALENSGKNYWLITGTETDWSYLNSFQQAIQKEVTNVEEQVAGSVNSNYSAFAVPQIDFESYPPLQTSFGELSITVPHDVLLEQTVSEFSTGSPLLATLQEGSRKIAVWDGEGIWKWRARTYVQDNSFQAFDDFIGNLVQYLASTKRRSRLDVSSEAFYYSNQPILITAQYFDKNYVFDPRASLRIQVRNTETEQTQEFPLLLRENFYEVNVSSLEAGTYAYTVSDATNTISNSGSFTILDVNVEEQFLNADVNKLQRLASESSGEAFYTAETASLIDEILENEAYKPIQRSQQKTVPLIDWYYLLIVLILSLAAEWFIRKYNGLI